MLTETLEILSCLEVQNPVQHFPEEKEGNIHSIASLYLVYFSDFYHGYTATV